MEYYQKVIVQLLCDQQASQSTVQKLAELLDRFSDYQPGLVVDRRLQADSRRFCVLSGITNDQLEHIRRLLDGASSVVERAERLSWFQTMARCWELPDCRDPENCCQLLAS